MKIQPKRLTAYLASLELTVAVLFLFLVLVVWGTVYQASHGLYAAQKEIFHAWIFWVGGVLPLPGLVMAGALLTVNLLMALVLRLSWTWRGMGIVLIHLGLILFLVGGFVSRRLSQESFLTLAEGETASTSSSATDWELAVWAESEGLRTVSALPVKGLSASDTLNFKAFAISFTVLAAYANCRLGEGGLSPVPAAAQTQGNIPGLILRSFAGGEAITLFGAAPGGIPFRQGKGEYMMQLRPRRFLLPGEFTLVDFKKITYPGSEIPRSYESHLKLMQSDGFVRDVVISMNRPLRIADYTFYQSSYDTEAGRERSTLSVVRNSGRLFPYYASLITFLGLLWFALQHMIRGPGRRKEGEGGEK